MDMGLKLKIVSPEKVEYKGNAVSVKVPGTMGLFEILTGHAPIISSLRHGTVEYTSEDGMRHEIGVSGGFVEVQKDNVALCVEKAQ